jgi:hypothetical protein
MLPAANFSNILRTPSFLELKQPCELLTTAVSIPAGQQYSKSVSSLDIVRYRHEACLLCGDVERGVEQMHSPIYLHKKGTNNIQLP